MTANAVSSATSVIAGGNISASGNVSGLSMNSATTLVAGGVVSAGGVATAGNVSAGTMNSTGNITSGASVNAVKVVAANDVNITSLPSRPSAPNLVTSVKALLPVEVEVDSMIVSAHGQSIPVPGCSPGTFPRVFLTPQLGRNQITGASPAWGSDIRVAGPLGGPWTVVALSQANLPLEQFEGLARIYCATQ